MQVKNQRISKSAATVIQTLYLSRISSLIIFAERWMLAS